MNHEDAVEEYYMDKLHLEQELEEQEWKLENLLEEVKDLESDIEYTKEQVAKICLEDYYCE